MAFRLILSAFLVASTLSLSAQEAVRKSAPPEIRELVQAVVAAANSGSADAWESFAQARFAPSLLKQQTREQRAQQYQQIADRFGTVAINGIRRQGPDAPLEMMVKGSKGAGAIVIDIESETSPLIVSLTIEADPSAAAEAAPGGLPPPPVDGKLSSDEISKRLDGYFTKLATDDVFSGVALVARNGVPVFLKAFGMADRDKKIANTIRTRFNIGSINKTFTQTAIRQLIREGKLSPQDTLGKIFPDYPQVASRSATIDQLLTHRAGLSDFFGPEFSAAPKDRFTSNADYFRFVSSRPPTFAPGERNQYCNGCYIALGAIVEKVSGMPYEQYVARNIFSRAEMTSTGYPRSDQPADDIAIGYTRRGGVQDLKTSHLRQGSGGQAGPQDLRPNTAMHGVTGSAAGGGYSTALDLLTYVKAIRAGKFPGTEPDLGIAGGAPGTNAIVETRGEWVVIVLTNFDPPTGQQVGNAIADALSR
jgi:D-alanyl-D-alanine carboxypeptidase